MFSFDIVDDINVSEAERPANAEATWIEFKMVAIYKCRSIGQQNKQQMWAGSSNKSNAKLCKLKMCILLLYQNKRTNVKKRKFKYEDVLQRRAVLHTVLVEYE